MAVGVRLDGDTDVEMRRMVGEVLIQVVGVGGVGDVGGDQKAVGVRLSKDVGAVGFFVGGGGEGFDDAFDGAGEEVASGALPQQRPDFFVVE